MKHIKLINEIKSNLTLEEFFDTLSELYQRKNYCVKFYCQESTFSFEIYSEDNAFHGKPIYESRVYDFWRIKRVMRKIIKDIKTKIKELEIADKYNL